MASVAAARGGRRGCRGRGFHCAFAGIRGAGQRVAAGTAAAGRTADRGAGGDEFGRARPGVRRAGPRNPRDGSAEIGRRVGRAGQCRDDCRERLQPGALAAAGRPGRGRVREVFDAIARKFRGSGRATGATAEGSAAAADHADQPADPRSVEGRGERRQRRGRAGPHDVAGAADRAGAGGQQPQRGGRGDRRGQHGRARPVRTAVFAVRADVPSADGRRRGLVLRTRDPGLPVRREDRPEAAQRRRNRCRAGCSGAGEH